MPLDEVLPAMRRHRAQMAVVMDEHGGTAGMVTMGTCSRKWSATSRKAAAAGRSYRDVSGRLRGARHRAARRRRATRSGVPLEHPKVQSVGGLVLTLLGRPAVGGDAVVYSACGSR